MCGIKGQLALVDQTSCGVHTNRQVLAVILAASEILNVLKVTKRPSIEVGAHDGRLLEADNLVAGTLALLGTALRHVGKSGLVLGDLDREFKGSFEIRLVEAGECTAGIRRLELGGEHVVVFFVSGHRCGSLDNWLVLRAVEACHLVVDGTLEGNSDESLVRLGNRLVKVQCSPLVLLIVGDIRGLDRALGLALFRLDLSGVDLELDGIESDLLGLSFDLDLNLDGTLEGPWSGCVDVVEGEVVVARPHAKKIMSRDPPVGLDLQTYVEGSTSLSEAMMANWLAWKLEQCRRGQKEWLRARLELKLERWRVERSIEQQCDTSRR